MTNGDHEQATETNDGVSVVIPVHNERGAIADTLHAVDAALREWGGTFEIVAVDDGSTDGSAEAIEESDVDAQLVRHETNRGYGAALKSGFGVARFGRLAFLDADGTYPPEELPRLIEAMDSAEMVVGERQEYRERASWGRQLGKAILVPLANYLAGRRIPDLNSGMRVVRRDLVERYWPLLPDGFSLTTTLTMSFLCAGWRVRYVPIRYGARVGTSKIQPVRDMGNFIMLILRTATYFRPLKVYVPLSAILVTASIAVVVISRIAAGQVMDVTALFLFIAGLQMLLIGVLADLVLKLLGTRK